MIGTLIPLILAMYKDTRREIDLNGIYMFGRRDITVLASGFQTAHHGAP